jgi:hypothetical protein
MRTNIHKIKGANWPFCNCTNAHKNLMWQQRSKTVKGRLQLRMNQWGQEAKSIVLPAPRRTASCLQHLRACNFVTQTPWSTFRAYSSVTHDRNFWAAIKCTSLALHFTKCESLRALKEIVQSVLTIKCALDRYAYRAIKEYIGSI